LVIICLTVSFFCSVFESDAIELKAHTTALSLALSCVYIGEV